MKLSNIKNRIYNDYFMKSRFSEYENLISQLKKNNYRFIKISEYNELLKSGKHVIIRHDIDSDVNIAKKMFEIEKKYNIKSTFYFRQCTFDKKFIEEINKYGSEVGYHFEEIATYVKKHRLKSIKEINDSMIDIKKILEKNINSFEKEFSIKLNSIASHGDFINRKYQISNNELFDKRMQKKYPDIVEAYDKRVEGLLDARISDDMFPKYWKPTNPYEAINNNKKNILLLIHTRWWDKAPFERFKNEIDRIIEGIKY